MDKIYLDNAATTPMSIEVAEVMHQANLNFIGNPSSIHSFGRSVRAQVETARKSVASIINSDPSEIIFTSGGTEANNAVIQMAVNGLDVTRIVTSKIEHSAILNPLDRLNKSINIEFVEIDSNGNINLENLSKLLDSEETTLVSLMHVNNEIGNINPIKAIAEICKIKKAFFHSDTVQSIAYFDLDVKSLGIDFLSCSAHKFHGPKGCGFLFAKQSLNISPFISGGSQERGLRGGTENISGISGLNKALTDAKNSQEENISHLKELKSHLLNELENNRIDYLKNGNWDNSSPAIANLSFKTNKDVSMLLFNLDLSGIAISGGSACTSGSNKGSHVLEELGVPMNYPAIRISFSKYTQKKDIDGFISVIIKLIGND